VSEQPRAPIEFRNAAVVGVNFSERIVETIAVPYNEEAVIEYRGELWRESFDQGSFDGVETRAGKIRANRGHDKNRTVGRAVNLYPSRIEGLVGEIRIAPTDLGDETLTLADEDMLSLSAGFGVRGSDQILDRSDPSELPRRRIKRAFLDHLAFVESPAYAGARVLAVRDEEGQPKGANAPALVTPNLDEVLAWINSRSSQSA
jgi:phage head maturation protease